MNTQVKQPETLMQAIKAFADPEFCHQMVERMRFRDGVRCPHCESDRVRFMAKSRKYQCNGCRKQFSLKTGTIFEGSPLGFDKWLSAVWMIANAKNGVSSCEIARALGVTQKSAWFMLHRIRYAMHHGSFEVKLGRNGEPVEVDETFIGGRARFMHKSQRAEKPISKRGTGGKTVVLGVLERGGKVRTEVVESVKRKNLDPLIRKHVESGSEVHTNCLPSYESLRDEYMHETIDHAKAYVRGNVHTNGMENYWSLLKRAIKGTYVSVEPFHLFRYLDEQAYRFNERKATDRQRFEGLLGMVSGKRLDYNTLTGECVS